jgi:hypothetical protein
MIDIWLLRRSLPTLMYVPSRGARRREFEDLGMTHAYAQGLPGRCRDGEPSGGSLFHRHDVHHENNPFYFLTSAECV